MLVAPTVSKEGEESFAHFSFGGRSTFVAASCVTAIQHELGHTLGMADTIGNRNGGTLRDAEKSRLLHLHSVDDSLQVANEGLKRDVCHIAVGETIAAPIVADQAPALGE